MGGYGSGGSNHSGRPTVGQCISLPISIFKTKGALQLNTAGSINIGENAFGFRLIYDDMMQLSWSLKDDREDNHYSQLLGFQWLAYKRTFGGHQHYWVCPQCNNRFNILYYYRRSFACRQCHRLQYVSQRESPVDRLRRRLEKLALRLNGQYEWGDFEAPIKPSGMHESKYARLKWQYEKVLSDYYRVCNLQVERLCSRMYR
jgi:hypothetical protein